MRTKDDAMVQKLFKSYDAQYWTKEEFRESVDKVLQDGYHKIHKLYLKKGQVMYMIPEDLFKLFMSF